MVMGTSGDQAPARLRPMVAWSTAVAGIAVALTLTVTFSDLQFGVRSAEGRIALETSQMIVAALVAYLVFGRSRRTARLRDLVVALAFILFSLASLLFISVRVGSSLEDGSRMERVAIWAPLLARTWGAALLAAAGLMHPARHVVRRSGALLLVASLGIVATTALGVGLFADRLPAGLSEELLLDTSNVAGTKADPWLQTFLLLLVALYGIAAIGSIARNDASTDPLDIMLVAGITAAAFARLNFYLYPSIFSDVVHLGDLLRLSFFVLLLCGATMEINRYWRVESETAAILERERLARELHDGLSQELSFIRSQTTAMANGTMYPGMVEAVAQSADRAVTESRAILLTLRDDDVVPIRDALAAIAKRTAGSLAVVTVEISIGLLVPRAVAHELGRVVMEATSNALRHGGATEIGISVSIDGSTMKLLISDDGKGYDTNDPTPGRHGLNGMGERACLLGGTMQIRSQRGRGTTVEVVIPDPSDSINHQRVSAHS